MTKTLAPFGTYAPTGWRKSLIATVRALPVARRGSFRPLWAKALGDGPFDVTREGVKYRLHLDNNPIEWGIMLMPHYEGPERAFLAKGLKAGDTFIDIGANVGIYCLTLAQNVGPTGKVVAVEADPVVQARVSENAALNGFTQLSIVLAAAGDREGEARFHAKQNPAHSRVSDEGETVVPMHTLLGILQSNGVTRVDALKIDVEGYEDQVLLPFFETAPKTHWPKRVVIEDIFIDGNVENCVKKMKALGYREAGRVRINTFLVLDETGQ